MKNNLLFFCVISFPLVLNHIQAKAQNIPDFLANEQTSIDGSEQSEPCIEGDGNDNLVIEWKDR